MRLMSKSVLIVVAALALTGVTAAAASAHEWLVNGGPVKESTSVTDTATEFTVIRQEEGGGEEIYTCALSGKGTVSAKGAGSITAWNLTSCIGSPKLPYGECEAGTKSGPTALHLPWTTQLSEESSGPVYNVVTGEIGFTWQCKDKSLLGSKLYKVTCNHVGERAELTKEPVGERWLVPSSGLLKCERELGSEKLKTGEAVLRGASILKAENKELSLSFN